MTGKGRHSQQYSNPELENQKKKPSVKDKTRTNDTQIASDKQKDDKEILDAQEKTEFNSGINRLRGCKKQEKSFTVPHC